MATTARAPDPEPLGPKKTAIVLAIVVACFCVLWPRVLQPALQGPQPPAAPAARPALPPHKAPDCCGVAWDGLKLDERFKAPVAPRPAPPPIYANTTLHRIILSINDSNLEYSAAYGGGAALRERGRTLGAPAPAPGPGLRGGLRASSLPPAAVASPSPHAHRSRMAAPASPGGGAGAGAGAMGFVMPLYTAAVLIFFLYTLSKVVMKRPGPAPVPSATFREHVFNQHHHLVTDAVWGLCADVNRHHSNLRQHSPESNHSQQNGNVDQTQRKLDKLLESDQEHQEDINEIKKADLEEDIVSKPLEIKQVLEQIQLEEKQQLEKQHLEEKQLLEQRMHELELERLRREEEQRELDQLQIDEKEFEVEEKVQANGSALQIAEETTIVDADDMRKDEEMAVKSESEEECAEEEEEEEEIEEIEEEEAGEDEGERSTLKVVGFETSAHAADGAPVAQRAPPAQGTAAAAPRGGGAAPAPADVSEIYLAGGGVPYAGRVLVATLGDLAPAPLAPRPTHAPLVVSGKMTLSLIPDDETKVEEPDTETLDFQSLDEIQDEQIEEEEVEEELEEEVEMEEELEEVKDSGPKSIENEETRRKLVSVEHLKPHQQELKSKDKELTYEDTDFDNQDVLTSTNASLVPQVESDFSTVEREIIDSDEYIINAIDNKQEIEEKKSNTEIEESGDLAAEEISDPYLTGCNLTQTVEGQAGLATDPDTDTLKLDTGLSDISEINALQPNTQEENIINITKPAQLVHQYSDLSQETVIECENEGMEDIIDLDDENKDFQRLYETDLDAAEELVTSVQIPNPQMGDPPLILESESEALVENSTDILGSNENLNSENNHIADEEPLPMLLTSKTDLSELVQETANIKDLIEKNDMSISYSQSGNGDKDKENEVPNVEFNALEIKEVAADKGDQPETSSMENENADIIHLQTAVDEEDIKNEHDVETPIPSHDSEKNVADFSGSDLLNESDALNKILEKHENVNLTVFDQTIALTGENEKFEPKKSEQDGQKGESENIKASEESRNLDVIETAQHSNMSPKSQQSFRKSEHITQKPSLPVVIYPNTVRTDQIVEDNNDADQTQVPATKTQTLNQQVTDIDDADSEFDRLLTELDDEN